MLKLIALRNGAVAAALMAGVFLLAAPAVAQDYPNASHARFFSNAANGFDSVSEPTIRRMERRRL